MRKSMMAEMGRLKAIHGKNSTGDGRWALSHILYGHRAALWSYTRVGEFNMYVRLIANTSTQIHR